MHQPTIAMKNIFVSIVAATIMGSGTFMALFVSIGVRCLFERVQFPLDYAIRVGLKSAAIVWIIVLILLLISCRGGGR